MARADEAVPDLRGLRRAVDAFRTPSLRRSLAQFASTLAAYVAVNAAMYAALRLSIWLTLLLAIPAAGLVVRLFIIQHDCGHGSFFRSKRANAWLGSFCSLITFTPFAFWRRQHNEHHGAFNNLDRRGSGLDLYSTCATLREYQAFTPVKRFAYRLSRHPAVTQVLLPPLIFLLLYRIPFGSPPGWSWERAGVYATDAAIAAAVLGLMIPLGVWPVAIVQLPIIALASIIGAWLFCVQHRFEEAEWAREESWSPLRASLSGSSFLKLPRVLQWFSGNIGFHHIHHLAARVPNYRLEACHAANPGLWAAPTLTLGQALRAPVFALWDEASGRMVRIPTGRAVTGSGG